jgi:hyperosmotically inducible periplasmic protein
MKRINTCLILALTIGSSVALNVSAQGVHNADNTAVNKRDQHHANPTAQDQSNGKADVKTSALLRRKIVGYKGLSMDAQNVKIIDEKGCVTLRGPVDSLKEKEIISTLAKECCGEIYKNELEVKAQK